MLVHLFAQCVFAVCIHYAVVIPRCLYNFMLTACCMFMVCINISMRLCSQLMSVITVKYKSRRSYSQLASSALSQLHLTSVDRKVWILWVACGSSVLCLLTAIHTNN